MSDTKISAEARQITIVEVAGLVVAVEGAVEALGQRVLLFLDRSALVVETERLGGARRGLGKLLAVTEDEEVDNAGELVDAVGSLRGIELVKVVEDGGGAEGVSSADVLGDVALLLELVDTAEDLALAVAAVGCALLVIGRAAGEQVEAVLLLGEHLLVVLRALVVRVLGGALVRQALCVGAHGRRAGEVALRGVRLQRVAVVDAERVELAGLVQHAVVAQAGPLERRVRGLAPRLTTNEIGVARETLARRQQRRPARHGQQAVVLLGVPVEQRVEGVAAKEVTRDRGEVGVAFHILANRLRAAHEGAAGGAGEHRGAFAAVIAVVPLRKQVVVGIAVREVRLGDALLGATGLL